MKLKLDFIKKYKLAIIIAIVLIILIISLILYFSQRQSEKELEFSDFEKLAIYNYLENDLLSVQTLYLKSNSNMNNVETIQVQVQEALDNYFSQNSNTTSVSTSTILSILGSDYGIDTSLVDFHGLVLSNYEYVPETDEIIVNTNLGGQSNISLYNEYSNFRDQKLKIARITKLTDNEYKVYGNIVENDNILYSTEVTLLLENNNFIIKACSINN